MSFDNYTQPNQIPSLARLWVCKRCGALVTPEALDTHDGWHQQLMNDNDILRRHVINELDRIIGEKDYPSIAQGLTQQLRSVVAAWPNVTILGVPYSEGGRELAEQYLP